MDVDTTQAMWEEANVGTNQQPIILRYMHGTFGRRCIITSKFVCDKHKGKNVYSPVDRICNSKIVSDEDITYWTKPICQCLDFSLIHRLGKKQSIIDTCKSIDLVMGGDHGQRKFRMVMKVIVRYGEAHAKDTHVIKLAHIDCVTETYDVLKASIAPPLNRCLNELKRSTINVYKNVDGVVAIQVGTREESICVYVHSISISSRHYS